MNKIIVTDSTSLKMLEDTEINIKNDSDITIIVNNNLKMVINILNKIKANIYIYSVDKSIDIILNMNREKAKCNLYYSNINYNNNLYEINVYHNKSKTEVNLYNHGVNVSNKKLDFRVTSKIFKDTSACTSNQDNRIINIKEGKSTICPNLLIDNYDVISSHSACIGKFKEDILFYLGSRGLSKKSSYNLLLRGFLLNNEDKLLKEFEKRLISI